MLVTGDVFMQPNSDAIFQAAIQLPEDERLTLVSRILDTMPEESTGLSIDDPDLVEELDRRSKDKEGSMPWSQLRNEL